MEPLETTTNEPASTISHEPPKEIHTEEELNYYYQKEIADYKSMLQEKGVQPFTDWNKFLPKIIHDPRYFKIPSQFRKILFEEFIRNYAEELRKDKAAKKRIAIQNFRDLIKEYEQKHDLAEEKYQKYDRFRDSFKNDARFLEVLKTISDPAIYFKDRVDEIKREQKKVLEEKKLKFSQLLMERLGDSKKIDKHTKWKHVKDELRSDSRYSLIGNDDKEKLFESFKHFLIEDRREKQRKLEEEEEEKGRGKRRDHHHPHVPEEKRDLLSQHKEKEAIDKLRILFSERIKNNTKLSWEDAKKKLQDQKDFGGDILTEKMKKELYESYVEQRRQINIAQFRGLLERNASKISITSTYDDICNLFADDLKFKALSEEDIKEVLNRYLNDIKAAIIDDFERLLDQTHYISKDSASEGAVYEELKKNLSQDPRYQKMEVFPDARERMLKKRIRYVKDSFEQKLKERGHLSDLLKDRIED